MIKKIECITIECNICGDVFEDANGFSIWPDDSCTAPEEYGWHVDEDDNHYCPECHEIDGEDRLIIKHQTEPAPVTGTSNE